MEKYYVPGGNVPHYYFYVLKFSYPSLLCCFQARAAAGFATIIFQFYALQSITLADQLV